MATGGLITIQKFVYLLDDWRYHEFVAHLTEMNATLPLRLVKTIRGRLPEFDTHEDLCKKIYGSFEKGPKQNFNQLASYTFRLSSVLAQNYPEYLHPNINKIQQLVNSGKGVEANFLAETLLDIAERVDDFQSSIFVLNFLAQQAFKIKDISTGLKLDAELNEVLTKEKTFTEIQLFAKNAIREPKKSKNALVEWRDYLLGFSNHTSPAIRMLSSHSYLILLFQFDLQAFEKPETHGVIQLLEKDLTNHAHVIFPFLIDVRGSLLVMKLNSGFAEADSKESKRDFEALTEHYDSIKYWKSFVNRGQLYLIAIQCSRLIATYEKYVWHADYVEKLPEQEMKLVKSLIRKCEDFFELGANATKHGYETMCYHMLYGILLILSGGKKLKPGVEKLEWLLTSYQQVNLGAETDSIFLCLMLGYFALKDYNQCDKTFKRYSKTIGNKPVFEANDIKIHAYYYLAQWLKTNNKLYAARFNALNSKEANKAARKTINELKSYFEVPR